LLIVGVDEKHITAGSRKHDCQIGGDRALAGTALRSTYDRDHGYSLDTNQISKGYHQDIFLMSG
jgi:hypothetical protein